MAKTTTTKKKRTVQTTRINGAKVRLVTGTDGKITIKPAPIDEWLLQAEQVRQLRALPEYGKSFLLVGGMEAGRRGAQEQVKMKATGLTAGQPDLTIFLPNGRVAMIENKNAEGRLSPEQKERHAALKAIGHTVKVIKTGDKDDAASQAVALVKSWIADCDENNLSVDLD
ncbi:VRR-NUC domain-containing protein [Rhizobium ruizarguesonis]